MSLSIGSTVTNDCQKVNPVTLTLFDPGCDPQLAKAAPNPYKNFIPRASLKDTYESYLLGNRLLVCNEDFADVLTHHEISLKLRGKCPWYENDSITVRFTIGYEEATSPTNGLSAVPLVYETEWEKDTTLSVTLASNKIAGVPWTAYGSANYGEATYQLEAIDPDPDDLCTEPTIQLTATLVRFGRAHDFLSGTPAEQTKTLSCEDWINGNVLTGFWAGTAFPLGPIGLVMAMDYTVEYVG